MADLLITHQRHGPWRLMTAAEAADCHSGITEAEYHNVAKCAAGVLLRVKRTSLVRLRLRRPGLMAEAAQSIDTFDLVPKKRVVPLRPGNCSSPKSSAFRGPRIEIWY